MAKKIIITKKSQPKKTNIKSTKIKNTNKKILASQPKEPKKQSKLQKNVVKKNKITNPSKTIIKKTINQPTPKITSSQKVIISKPKIKKNLIKKINKKLTNPKLKNTKIQEKQEHWFKRILKSIRNTIIVILPFILIAVALWFIITNFFPEAAAKIGPVAKAAWAKTKGFVNWINEQGTNFLKGLGCLPKVASWIFSGIIITIGLILGLACCGIPVIGPFIGIPILIATAIYTGIIVWDNQTTPKEDSPPKPLVEVYDLDAIKKEEEAKLKQELTEYATELQKQGKSSEEIEKQTNNKKEELLQDLQKKKKQQQINQPN
ncbi:hypothetical protein HPP_4660 [Hydrangea phyllody phytoplasma]|uniref:Uncharacterized protein n=1 Tax=Hydrangea phyllody phytoplasma TaxID=238673 RepID=A0ABQ1EJN3_9MOLU|nr:hypothetical protein [Hydrangea phyllody phytoplasma]GFZ75508.1 hypothetical protein HPP_4660 [Hydrangea phyllody phytoplasma]GLH62083.1 hypothetical protein HP2P_4900 [Hydrangea phyllody phytoplasma]